MIRIFFIITAGIQSKAEKDAKLVNIFFSESSRSQTFQWKNTIYSRLKIHTIQLFRSNTQHNSGLTFCLDVLKPL